MGGMQMLASPWGAAQLTATLAMWVAMMAAMMLPSAVPVVRIVAATNRRAAAGGAPATPPALFVGGYLLVWIAYSVLATVSQAALTALAQLTPALALRDPRLQAAFLLAAGAYQVTPWKLGCLARCRSPFAMLLLHWRDGPAGALRLGVEHGLTCVGCCWALMLVLFVGGVMQLAWIAVLALVILLEKLPALGAWVPRLAGAGLLAWGIALLAA